MSIKRLLIINGNQFGYSAGHYYYCKYLAGGYRIDYICFDKGKKKMALDGVKVHYIPFDTGKIRRIFSFVTSSIRLSRNIKPDVLFVVYFNLCFLLALFCKAKKDKTLDIRTGSLDASPLKRRIFNAIIKIQSSFYTKRIILSESLLNELGIDRRGTLILPLGAEEFYAGSHDFTNPRLLYIGTLDNRKIYETILGLKIFIKKFPRVQVHYDLIGFGSGGEVKRITDVIAESGLDEIVVYHGELNHTEIENFFKDDNVGVAYIPMEDYYQFQPATKIFEYALSGLYTIATNTFENKRIITPENGILCNDDAGSFANALEQYYQNRSTLDASLIRGTLLDYEWKTLVKNKLEPFLST